MQRRLELIFGKTPVRAEKQNKKIKQSLYKTIYIWTTDGDGFWAWINEKNCKYIIGYKLKDYGWVKFKIKLDKIEDFVEL